jgi:hypothetical protein
MLDAILYNEILESVEVLNILPPGSRCARAGFFLARDLEENVPKKVRRLRGKEWRGVDAGSLGSFLSSLFQVDSGKETSFELVLAVSGVSVGPSILNPNNPFLPER